MIIDTSKLKKDIIYLVIMAVLGGIGGYAHKEKTDSMFTEEQVTEIAKKVYQLGAVKGATEFCKQGDKL